MGREWVRPGRRSRSVSLINVHACMTTFLFAEKPLSLVLGSVSFLLSFTDTNRPFSVKTTMLLLFYCEAQRRPFQRKINDARKI